MEVLRVNIIDAAGAVSFVAPCHALKVIAAACAKNPATIRELLDHAEPFDPRLKRYILDGLAVFDEHNSEESVGAIRATIEESPVEAHPPFRIIDAYTREWSLAPVHAGLVIFNLPAKRIVQVQNACAEVEREDRGHVHVDGEPTERLYEYALPEEWALVP